MGHKLVCMDCRLALNKSLDSRKQTGPSTCPECSEDMIELPHRFRPPKKSEVKKWAVVDYLVSEGFRYEHVYDWAVPEKMSEAIEFMERQKKRKTIYNVRLYGYPGLRAE